MILDMKRSSGPSVYNFAVMVQENWKSPKAMDNVYY